MVVRVRIIEVENLKCSPFRTLLVHGFSPNSGKLKYAANFEFYQTLNKSVKSAIIVPQGNLQWYM